MHKLNARDSQRLTKAESLAMLCDSLAEAHDVESASPRVSVAVALRRGRVVGTAFFAVGLLAVLTEVFRRGVELHTFDKATKTPAQRAAMLDKYNSYSGNAASALGRPVELLLAVMAQLLVVRFMAASLVQPQFRRRTAIAAVVLSGGIGFLLNNGLNALNVQTIDVETIPVITMSDLSVATDTNSSRSQISNVTQSVPEDQARNPISNTILRSLVLARVPKALPQCAKSNNVNLRFPDDYVDYGFSPRDWMARMIPQALDAERLHIVLNATDESVNRNVTPDKLPMNASRAADLFLTSVLLSYTYIPWGKQALWEDSYNGTNTTPATAVVAGLLPPNGTETQQRAWFLRESRSFLTRRPIQTQNLSRADVMLEFARVELSPTIAFESVTWEVEMDPNALATSANKTTNRYTELAPLDCGPWPGVCLVPRRVTDTPVVVHAFAVCANADGSETLRSAPRNTTLFDYFVQCPTTSNASLLLVSAAKRLVADAVHENATANASGIYPSTSGSAVVTNLRKVYTFTVGRLGWTWQDLATKYKAECATDACVGLDFALGNGDQTVVVGAASVPLNLVNGPYYQATFLEIDQHPVPIVRLAEPHMLTADKERWNTLAGDFLLPHNIHSITWDRSRRQSGQQCSVVQEDRQQLVLNNHLYMENALQTTYTAGLFFLFQNGVVKDALAVGGGKTLQFDGNVENIAVRISVPTDNATLTYIGCAVLAAALAIAVLWSQLPTRTDPLARISSPHVMARVLLDDRTFPSLLLHRRVVHECERDGTIVTSPADAFLIDTIVFAPQEDKQTGATPYRRHSDAEKRTLT